MDTRRSSPQLPRAPGNEASNFVDLSCRLTVDADGTSHLAATLPQEIPVFMTDGIAVLEDGHSEGVVNVMALELKWQIFSPM